MADWSKCPDVERVEGRVSGALVLKDTRIPVAAVLDNVRDGYTPEQMAAEIYDGLPIERARRVIAFAKRYDPHFA